MKREENNLGIKIVEKYKAPQVEVIEVQIMNEILSGGSAGGDYEIEPLWGE